jgi:uncharacterized protein with GYD domain
MSISAASESQGSGLRFTSECKGGSMPKYLLQGKYTLTGAQGLSTAPPSDPKNPIDTAKLATERVKYITSVIASVGGKVEAFYFAFGDVDVIIVADFPDHQSVTAFTLAVNQSGGTIVTTTVLLLPSEVDSAIAKGLNLRPPGT